MKSGAIKTDWSWIPSDEVNEPSEELVGGVRVEVMAAYFDVPRATRFLYDDAKRQFIIDFKYLSEEEPLELIEKENISLKLGKKSKRIYQILIDKSAMHVDLSNRITFNLVVDADEIFKKNINKFNNISKKNTELVEKCLDWGITKKMLNLTTVAYA